MVKTKYLHRKYRNTGWDKNWDNRKYKRVPKHKLHDILPKKEPIRPKHYTHSLDFTPMSEFIESKIGEKWDNVYSEILTKIKPKFRHQMHWNLEWMIYNIVYTKDFKPYGKWDRLLINSVFIDENNILRQYNSEEDLLIDSKKKIRREKIRRILEAQEAQEAQEEE